ncbi:hypothetical protein NL676_029857 [Syzygium grande]|nr:hypothetical protein NL676_029857 [Syzygium grande]
MLHPVDLLLSNHPALSFVMLTWKSIKVSSTLLGFVLIGRATFVFPYYSYPAWSQFGGPSLCMALSPWHLLITRHVFAPLSSVAEIFISFTLEWKRIEKWGVVSNSPGKIDQGQLGVIGTLFRLEEPPSFSLSFLSNLARKSKYEKIRLKQQVTFWCAGLMRGAVSMALAYYQFTRSGAKLRSNAFMIMSTITVVLFSTVVRRHFICESNWWHNV